MLTSPHTNFQIISDMLLEVSCKRINKINKMNSLLKLHDHDAGVKHGELHLKTGTRRDAQPLEVKSARQETHLGQHLNDDVYIHASWLKLQTPENQNFRINVRSTYSTGRLSKM